MRDAFLVPGSGLLPSGEVPPLIANRLDWIVAHETGSELVILLSGGTVYKAPPLDPAGRPIFESVAAARYLVARGFDTNRLLTETASYDTIGNAYFARVIHTDPLALRRLAVVVSEFHAARCRVVFDWIFGIEPCSTVEYVVLPDAGLTAEVRAARYAKEAESLRGLGDKPARLRTLRDVHRFLFAEHAAYAAARMDTAPPSLPASLLGSY